MGETQTGEETVRVGTGPALPKVLLVQGEARQIPLQDESVHMVCTSPPYWGLRDYGTATWQDGDPTHLHDRIAARNGRGGSGSPGKQTTGVYPSTFPADVCSCGAIRIDHQLGNEKLHDCLGWASGQGCDECYLCHMRQVFREIWRVLRNDGTVWLNIGDAYAGSWGAQSRPNGPDLKSTLTGGSMLSARQIKAHPRGTQVGSLKHTPGCKPKDLLGLPWRLALALQQDGWYLRSDIIWSKPNPMPGPQQDRPTTAHEYVFLLSKQSHYFYDTKAIAEPLADYGQRGTDSTYEHVPNGGDNAGLGALAQRIRQARLDGNCTMTRTARDVWHLATEPCPLAHFATMPTALAARCIKAGSPHRGLVLDPFCGSGTTLLVARALGRHGVGLDLSWSYLRDIARQRLGLKALTAWEHGMTPQLVTYDDLPLFGVGGEEVR